MPDYLGFSIALQSQHTAAFIPEDDPIFDSPTSGHGPPPTAQVASNVSGTASVSTTIIAPPSTQFCICYSCPPPSPGSDVSFYLFKLYSRGRCLLSWGCNEQDRTGGHYESQDKAGSQDLDRRRWSGKAMFGIFNNGTDFEGRKIVEKMGFMIPDSHCGGDFEVRIFRAKGRRREKRVKLEVATGFDMAAGDLRLRSIGRANPDEPRHMYTYALIDPKDEPYLVFKYCFEANEPEQGFLSKARMIGDECLAALSDEEIDSSTSSSETPSPKISSSKLSPFAEPTAHVPDTAMSLNKRLSFPPQIALQSTTTRREPFSPIKNEAHEDIASDSDDRKMNVDKFRSSHKAVGKRAAGMSMARTPWSASASDEALIEPATETSSAERTKSGSGKFLRNVVANALWRRTFTQ